MKKLPPKAEEVSAQRKDTPGGPIAIGWKEYVDFPEWRLKHVKAKIDTGARTSALDVLAYELHEDAAGGTIAELHLSLDRKNPERRTIIQVPVLRMVAVCNSGGVREYRPLIEVNIRLGQVTKRVQLTVANRSGMLFRMILGRRALDGDFLVDVSKKYLLRKKST